MKVFFYKPVLFLPMGFMLIGCGPGLVPPSPVVLSVSPTEGPSTGGTDVTITGFNFTSETRVDFGGAPCGDHVVVSSTLITCNTAAHKPALATARASDNGFEGTLPSAFNYLITKWKFLDGNGEMGLNKDPAKTASLWGVASFNSKLYRAWGETRWNSRTNSRHRL